MPPACSVEGRPFGRNASFHVSMELGSTTAELSTTFAVTFSEGMTESTSTMLSSMAIRRFGSVYFLIVISNNSFSRKLRPEAGVVLCIHHTTSVTDFKRIYSSG